MNASAAKDSGSGDRLKLREYVGYALGDTASNFFFQTFNFYLTYYYVSVWGLPGAVLIWMMPLIKLIDAVNDPAMGLIADRTTTRWGKYRPYLLWGAIPYGICGYLLFAGPDFGETGKIVYAFITYMLMLMSYTVINVPYSSILGVISPSSRTRAVASSFRFVGAFSGGFLITLLVWPLVQTLGKRPDGTVDEMQGFQWAMAIFAVASVILFWISFATTKERVTPPPKQKTNVKGELKELVCNKPWVILLIASIFSTTFLALRGGSTIFYFKYVVCDAYTPVFFAGTIFKLDRLTVFLASGMLAQLIGTAGLGFFVRRLDKKIAAAAFSAVTGVCFMLFFFLPYQYYWLLIAVNMLGYLSMGPASTLVWALYGDVADYGEWKFKRRSTGLVYSASLFSIKTGLVVGGFLLLWFLGQYGFEKDATEQTARAAYGILLAFSVVPGVFALLKAGAFLLYPLNQKQVDQIERDLSARHAAEAAGSEPA